jgi:hypothetical protein
MQVRRDSRQGNHRRALPASKLEKMEKGGSINMLLFYCTDCKGMDPHACQRPGNAGEVFKLTWEEKLG